MTVITMSRRELARLHAMIDLVDGRISVEEAAGVMALGRRQVFRLQRRFLEDGAQALASKRRGQRSNRSHGPALRNVVMQLVRERYPDVGPTLAAEKLRELHGLPIATETLWLWMVADGLWLCRRDRKKHVHQPRHRRDCLGELVQIDGRQHWWFEDRGPQRTLLVFIDVGCAEVLKRNLMTGYCCPAAQPHQLDITTDVDNPIFGVHPRMKPTVPLSRLSPKTGPAA